MALEQISSTRTQTGFATPRGWARPSRLLGWLLAGLLSLGKGSALPQLGDKKK